MSHTKFVSFVLSMLLFNVGCKNNAFKQTETGSSREQTEGGAGDPAAPSPEVPPSNPSPGAPQPPVVTECRNQQGQIIPTYETHAKGIIERNCASCHNSIQPPFFSKSLENLKAFDPGFTHGMTRIKFTGFGQMPPTGPLKADEIQTLEKWVSGGLIANLSDCVRLNPPPVVVPPPPMNPTPVNPPPASPPPANPPPVNPTPSAFNRNIDVGGDSSLTLDGETWLSDNQAVSQGLQVLDANTWKGSYNFTLTPAADANTKALLQSLLWRGGVANGQGFRLNQTVPNGTYKVYLWMVENHMSGFRNADVRLEGQTAATGIGDLPLGYWQKYGPYSTTVTDGVLNVEILRSTKGDPLLAGLEIRSTAAGTPPVVPAPPPVVPTPPPVVPAPPANPRPPGTSPFACTSPDTVGATPLRRLTKSELTNTLEQLLGTEILTAIKSSLDQLPDEAIATDVTSFVNSYSALHVNAIFGLANRAADEVTLNVNRIKLIVGACATDKSVPEPCLSEFITRFGARALRRPLTASEKIMLVDFFKSGVNAKDSIIRVILVLLQSPQFLNHVELGVDGSPERADKSFQLTQFELASRLSYLATDSMPDETLFQAATEGRLNSEAEIAAQVERLALTSRGKNKISRFFDYLVRTDKISDPKQSAAELNGINPVGLGQEIKRELAQFLDYVVWQTQGNYSALVTSDRSFAQTPALATIYGHQLASPSAVQTMGNGRMGLLLRAPALMSGDGETHPISRGITWRRRFMCDEIPAPPPNAVLPEVGDVDSLSARMMYSTRERTRLKTNSVTCMGCHSAINPVGFALENFDPLGRTRTVETVYDPAGKAVKYHTIDSFASVDMYDGTSPRGIQNGIELVRSLADGTKGSACFVRQIYRYYNYRREAAQNSCVLSEMHNANDKSVLEIFKTATKNKSIQWKKVED